MRARIHPQLRVFAITATLVFSLLPAATAQALPQFKQLPATVWGHTYIGSAPKVGAKLNAQAPGIKLEAKSKFNVEYTNFPDWAVKDMQAALNVWAANFQSDVPIEVTATWRRAANPDELGSARAVDLFGGFAGAPDPNLFYPSALANALAKKDLDKRAKDIIITVNSEPSVGSWDVRNDGTPRATEFDLQSVLIHELAHGLGFLSNSTYVSGLGLGLWEDPGPTAYDAYIRTPDNQRVSDLPSPSAEFGRALRRTLIWSGPLGKAANGNISPLLYTPSQYQGGSSVSHLDEETFKASGKDAVMTPNLGPGETFHELGPLLIAMMLDLRNKPEIGIPAGVPSVVRNPHAIVSDGSAVITFDPPINARASQVSQYEIKIIQSNKTLRTNTSPAIVSGLNNGTPYSFSISALAPNGNSIPVTTLLVTPQSAWPATILDATADGKSPATATLNGKPLVIYSDGKSGLIKIATWNGKSWLKSVLDGNTNKDGRSSHPMGGQISACVSGIVGKQLLHLFYVDQTDKDLRYAKYDGVKTQYEVVDGNGPIVQPYQEAQRVRSKSDVSVSNACAVTTTSIQVFYRDESQGILLGANRSLKAAAGSWNYEIVDGEKKTEGHTMGDVAFHLSAVVSGAKTYLLYDCVLDINSRNRATAGEIRLASRTGTSTSDWRYQAFDTTGSDLMVPGYQVTLAKTPQGLTAAWLVASSLSIPKPVALRWTSISSETTTATVNNAVSDEFGLTDGPLVTDGTSLLFSCQERLCALNLKALPKISLATQYQHGDDARATWLLVGKIRYAVSSVAGKVTLMKG